MSTGQQAGERTPEQSDIAIVGGGIVGLAVARELIARSPGSSLCVLEREADVGEHQTGHNSGVIHAGVYYTPGSLKARLCVEGAREMYEYCEQRGIAHERCGKLILATDSSELERLDEIERRGQANGVEGLRRLDPAEIEQIEPHARGIAGLHSPNTGIVDFAALLRYLAGAGYDGYLSFETHYQRDGSGELATRDCVAALRSIAAQAQVELPV